MVVSQDGHVLSLVHQLLLLTLMELATNLTGWQLHLRCVSVFASIFTPISQPFLPHFHHNFLAMRPLAIHCYSAENINLLRKCTQLCVTLCQQELKSMKRSARCCSTKCCLIYCQPCSNSLAGLESARLMQQWQYLVVGEGCIERCALDWLMFRLTCDCQTLPVCIASFSLYHVPFPLPCSRL